MFSLFSWTCIQWDIGLEARTTHPFKEAASDDDTVKKLGNAGVVSASFSIAVVVHGDELTIADSRYCCWWHWRENGGLNELSEKHGPHTIVVLTQHRVAEVSHSLTFV